MTVRTAESVASAASVARDPARQAGIAPLRCLLRVAGQARSADERGDYAVFIAVIATMLLFFGSIAYEAPRVLAARSDALHYANEAARVAAATVASGGTLQDAREAAQTRVRRTTLIYGSEVDVVTVECVGTRVEVDIVTDFLYRSVIGLFRQTQVITAKGAAEATLVLPSNTTSDFGYVAECALN